MNKIGGRIILWLLILSLIVFTAIRTLHFLQLTFPPELAYVAYLGLAAFDIGVLGWFYFATQSAEGAGQRTVAYGMVFVCMTGVVITTIADMVIASAQNGLTKLPPQWGTIGLWGVIIIIVLNVVAGIVVHLCDPKHVRHMAMEKARDRIHSTVLSHISAQADTIAPQIAQHTAQHWANQVIHEMTGSIPGAYNTPSLPPAKVVDSVPPAPRQAASRDHVLDPHKVREEIDSEKKKKPLIDFSLPKEVSKKTQKIEITSPEEDHEEEEEAEPERDITSMSMDKAWQEHIATNAQTPTEPKKKERGSNRKNVTRREVLGLENQDD